MIDIDKMVFNTLTGTRGMRMEKIDRVDMKAYKGAFVYFTTDFEVTVAPQKADGSRAYASRNLKTGHRSNGEFPAVPSNVIRLGRDPLYGDGLEVVAIYAPTKECL